MISREGAKLFLRLLYSFFASLREILSTGVTN